mgnify:CR=1 FL=1
MPKGDKKIGRPLAVIDWEEVDKLFALQCTGEEIAGYLGFSYDTIERAMKREHGLSFAEYSQQKGSVGKISLRRRQWKTAESNPTMQIWLGKQMLGQSDKSEVDTSVSVVVGKDDAGL